MNMKEYNKSFHNIYNVLSFLFFLPIPYRIVTFIIVMDCDIKW
jgi:hypothetical protein